VRDGMIIGYAALLRASHGAPPAYRIMYEYKYVSFLVAAGIEPPIFRILQT